MSNYFPNYRESYDDYLCHHGILGMHWGVRRFQNKDGSLTSEGKKRYSGDKYVNVDGSLTKNGLQRYIHPHSNPDYGTKYNEDKMYSDFIHQKSGKLNEKGTAFFNNLAKQYPKPSDDELYSKDPKVQKKVIDFMVEHSVMIDPLYNDAVKAERSFTKRIENESIGNDWFHNPGDFKGTKATGEQLKKVQKARQNYRNVDRGDHSAIKAALENYNQERLNLARVVLKDIGYDPNNRKAAIYVDSLLYY